MCTLYWTFYLALLTATCSVHKSVCLTPSFSSSRALMLLLLLLLIIVLPIGIMCVCGALIEGWYPDMLMTCSCPFLIGNLLQSSGWQLLKAPLSQVEIHWSQLEIVLSGIISEGMQIPACFCVVSDLISSYAHGWLYKRAQFVSIGLPI